MFRTFIFFRSDICSFSPAVRIWWPGRVIDLLNRLPESTIYWGGTAEGICADFIGACLVLEGRIGPLEVSNLELRWDRIGELAEYVDTPEYDERWRALLLEEIGLTLGQAGEPPVLIDLDGPPFHATRGGVVLCRSRSGDENAEETPQWVAPG
jgi:hypothetical protein